MKAMSLHRRILLAFVLCTTLVALLFGVCAIIFAYHTEDRVFETLLQSEAAYAEQQLVSQEAIKPRLNFIRYYENITELPQQIRSTLQRSPERTEFALDAGQHVHLLPLSKGFLLADVTGQLVVRQMRSQLSAFLLTLLLCTMLSAAGFAYLLARRLLKPLNRLTQIVDHAGQGNAVLAAPAQFAESFIADEIGRLAQALQKSWARVAEFVSREQQFTQDLSHELRTPLAVIQGALTLLQHSQLTEQQRRYLERLQHAQLQMNQTIDTLFLLAREQVVLPEPILLLPVVEQSILQQHHKLAGKAIALKLQIAADERVMLDSNSLLLLLNNLLGNAFEYTQAGTIEVRFARQQLIVQDSGAGIDEAIQSQIFDAGIKGKNSQGLGVGLSLVKRLSDKHGISCAILSDRDGTCVRLIFPD